MASLTERAKGKLAALSTSFDELEEVLEPLFAQTLPETIVGLEPIQQAKLQTVLPYLVYDLVFIYLKSRGIDPKTHPVVSELERVKQYFDKISVAENPPQKRTELDKNAAQRFIKHAITQATYVKPPMEETPGPSSSVQVQTKFTSKMLERQLYEKKLKEQDAQGSEEEELEVFDGDDKMSVDAPISEPTKNTKGKAKEVSSTIDDSKPKGSNKRRRPVVDPFAGYGDDTLTPVPATRSPSNTSTPNTQQNKKRVVDDSMTDSAAGTPVPAAESSSGPAKKTKKTKKKHRKSLP
ncbi:Nuclear nucleic acid-binding protein C1D [Termitomyces sp. J132]|nr:hypothetical protein H2248_001331 [Termitomyces sp. 'cryptogamus']KNZ76377.1 Nuclear nucleic acid-binding protein C1D [Termitomyces sp. J132]